MADRKSNNTNTQKRYHQRGQELPQYELGIFKWTAVELRAIDQKIMEFFDKTRRVLSSKIQYSLTVPITQGMRKMINWSSRLSPSRIF